LGKEVAMSQESVRRWLRAFAADERGVTVIEYALMLVIFSLVVTGALAMLGTNLVGLFEKVSTILS
jgi:Flp pilus assembly pilin Flp